MISIMGEMPFYVADTKPLCHGGIQNPELVLLCGYELA
jgi:hypothetical protein